MIYRKNVWVYVFSRKNYLTVDEKSFCFVSGKQLLLDDNPDLKIICM